MITSKDQYVLTNAKSYFREHLCAGDYYSESKQVAGQWYGDGAEKLGLSGSIKELDFLALCEGKHPDNLSKLTQRTCNTNRRIFSDFVVSCPKSVSLLGLMVDERIVQLHNECVLLALQEVEGFAAARVRAGGQNTHRTTKNLIVGLFNHDTSRALDPMIHSHCVIFNATHDSVENKWKALEKVDMLRSIRYINSVYEHELCRGLRKLGYQIEVGENGLFEIAGLTRGLIEKFSKRHTEIIQKSQVHLQEKGLTARNLSALSEQVRLDTRQRKAPSQNPQKLKNLWEEQLTEAEKQILETAHAYTKKPAQQTLKADAQQAITFAKNHWFERNTTAQDYELWALALEHYRSEDFSVGALKAEFQKLEFLQNTHNQREVTTEEVLATEAFLVKTTQEGIGQRQAIGVGEERAPNSGRKLFEKSFPSQTHPSKTFGSRDSSLAGIGAGPHKKDLLANVSLSAEQKEAIATILNSRDFVTLFRGAAGTGKSHTLGALRAILEQEGHTLHVCAPQTQQVQALQKDGFEQAQTLSSFLGKEFIHGALPQTPQGTCPLTQKFLGRAREEPFSQKGFLEQRPAVILVDEAGQISGRQMAELFLFAQQNHCRLILSGDTRQHGSIGATDSLRLLEQHTATCRAELRGIRRQDPRLAKSSQEVQQIQEYKRAVWLASNGRAGDSFRKIQQNGWVLEEADNFKRFEALKLQYKQSILQNEPVLVVSQTKNHVEQLNKELRDIWLARKLMYGVPPQTPQGTGPLTQKFLERVREQPFSQKGFLGSTLTKTFRPIDQTPAEKQDWKTYQPGMLINFFSTYGKIKKGSICTVSKVLLDGIEVQHEAKKHLVNFRYAQRWQRVEERNLEITQGEQLQMKSNLMSSNGVLLANGERVTLLEKTEDALVLQKSDGQTAHLAAKNAILDYGYAVTSYASQGKTVDKVILWDSGSAGASSLEQWYVSLSRGRKAACILTQNAQDLQERIVSSCGQKPAIEVAWKPLNYQKIENFGWDEKKVQQVVQAAFEDKEEKAQRQEKIEAEVKALRQKILLLQKEQEEVCEKINAKQHEEYLAACEVYKEQFANYCNNRSSLKKSLRWIIGAKQIEEPKMPKMPQRIGIKALEENFTTLQQKFQLIESIKDSFDQVRTLQKEKQQLEELLPKKQAMTLEKRQEQSMGWRI